MYDDDDDEMSLPPLGPAFNEQYIYDDPEANQYALPLVNKPTGNNDIIGNNNYAVLYYSRAFHIHKYIGIYIYIYDRTTRTVPNQTKHFHSFRLQCRQSLPLHLVEYLRVI